MPGASWSLWHRAAPASSTQAFWLHARPGASYLSCLGETQEAGIPTLCKNNCFLHPFSSFPVIFGFTTVRCHIQATSVFAFSHFGLEK
jgi:hypothetical protein